MVNPPPEHITYAAKWGQQYAVNPRLLLAICWQETHFGTLGEGLRGYWLGYGAYDSGTDTKHPEWRFEGQYHYGARLLASWGVHDIADVMAGKAASWASDPRWEAGVERSYNSLAGLDLGTSGIRPEPPASGKDDDMQMFVEPGTTKTIQYQARPGTLFLWADNFGDYDAASSKFTINNGALVRFAVGSEGAWINLTDHFLVLPKLKDQAVRLPGNIRGGVVVSVYPASLGADGKVYGGSGVNAEIAYD